MRILTEEDFTIKGVRLGEKDAMRLHSFIRKGLLGQFVLSENTDGPNEWLLSKLVGDSNWKSWPSRSLRIPKSANYIDLFHNKVILITIWKNPHEDLKVVERVFFGDTVWWITTKKKRIAKRADDILREEKRKFKINYPLAFAEVSRILAEYGLAGVIEGYEMRGCTDYYDLHCPIVIDLYLQRNIRIAVNDLKSLGLSDESIKNLAIQLFDVLDKYEVLRWPCYLHSSNPDIYLVQDTNTIYTTWSVPKHGTVLKKSPRL